MPLPQPVDAAQCDRLTSAASQRPSALMADASSSPPAGDGVGQLMGELCSISPQAAQAVYMKRPGCPRLD